MEIFESSHPIPDERSIVGADRLIKILEKADKEDLIFAAITGGSSALVNKPAGEITLEDLQKINTALLNCGAEIGKINTVRKHLCLLKGGRLVQYGQPAMVITLTFDTARRICHGQIYVFQIQLHLRMQCRCLKISVSGKPCAY
mgnify:CR=1 FL=1